MGTTDQISNRNGLIQPYDIIGDIHGYADVLEELLRKLGYEMPADTWQHPGGRKVIFLGDYIDRGPSIRRTLRIVRGMVEKGEALALMGNHEYNALLYHTPDSKGGWLRPHVAKNVGQHAVTLAQFWNHRDEWDDHLAWFARLPLWLDLGGFRAVHASWNETDERCGRKVRTEGADERCGRRVRKSPSWMTTYRDPEALWPSSPSTRSATPSDSSTLLTLRPF